MTDDERAEHGVSRRTMLKRVGAAGAIAWVTPVISSLNTPAFAASANPHPECEGAACGTFRACSSGNGDCVCVESDQGGFCFPGSTSCLIEGDCPSGSSSECNPGSVCVSNTCCNRPVCVPTSITDLCPAGEGSRSAGTTRPSSGPGTIGG